MFFRLRMTVNGPTPRRGARIDLRLRDVAVAVWQGPHPNDASREVVVVEATIQRAPSEVLERFLLAGSDQDRETPDDVLDLGTEFGRELSEACREVVYVLRWRQHADIPHTPFASFGTEWSSDGVEWATVPGRGYVYGTVTVGLHLVPETARNVEELVNRGVHEPIAHQLLREAQDVLRGNPRSSIVVGVAAIESGFKQLVAELVPEAEWLVQNVPSPPIVKMLQNFLPRLPARHTVNGRVVAPPKFVRSLLTAAVEERNKVTHLGVGSMYAGEVQQTLNAMRDTLYLFDFYAGHEWALEQTSIEFRDALGT